MLILNQAPTNAGAKAIWDATPKNIRPVFEAPLKTEKIKIKPIE